MGLCKAVLPWQETTLLRYQVNSLLSAGIPDVIVVVGHKAETLRPLIERVSSVTTVLNLRYRTGKSSSVRAGLRHLGTDADHILVLAVDQPRSSDLIRQVLDAHITHGAPVTYPTYQGKGGHPVVFSRDLLPEMTRIRESHQGLREVVQHHRHEAVRIPVDDSHVLLDLNLPHDYQRAFERG
jgi:molybdenum cofactor cytidylyltransferase